MMNKEDYQDDSIPALNEKSNLNKDVLFKYVLVAGVIVIVIAGLVFVNDNGEVKKEKKPEDFKIESRLPPIKIADAVKPPPPVTPTLPETTANGERKLSWRERRRLPPVLYSGTGGGSNIESNNRQPINNNQENASIKKVETEVELVTASILSNLDFLITAGTYIDCDIQGALDAAMPGMTVCYTPRDIYSDNGNVLLLPKGTKITGESLSDVKQGQTRIATIWTQAKTPDGVVISLQSAKGTDTLGRVGVEGYTESHFMERFGAAILVSLLETTSSVAAQNLIPRNGGGNLNINTGGSSGGTEVVQSILQQYQNIPISIVKNEGESIRIAINKNLDFSSVYELEVKP
jgi:type IV secretion system protein VirB10